MIDLHSHLVPAVDDGARTLDDTLDAVRRMVERGVSRIVTTPHLSATETAHSARLNAVLEPMDEAFERARAKVLEEFPQVVFERGHEVRLDVPDPDLSDPRLRLADSRVVLVEWAGLQFPPGTPAVLEGLVRQGIRPLIAHPERYRVHDARLSAPEQWREAGAWLQVNHGSLVGRYGPQARARALTLLERGWVDCLSSDFHARDHLRLYIREARELFERMDREDVWTLLTVTNPERILGGEEPAPVAPVSFPRGVMDRIRSLLKGIG